MFSHPQTIHQAVSSIITDFISIKQDIKYIVVCENRGVLEAAVKTFLPKIKGFGLTGTSGVQNTFEFNNGAACAQVLLTADLRLAHTHFWDKVFILSVGDDEHYVSMQDVGIGYKKLAKAQQVVHWPIDDYLRSVSEDSQRALLEGYLARPRQKSAEIVKARQGALMQKVLEHFEGQTEENYTTSAFGFTMNVEFYPTHVRGHAINAYQALLTELREVHGKSKVLSYPSQDMCETRLTDFLRFEGMLSFELGLSVGVVVEIETVMLGHQMIKLRVDQYHAA